MAIASSRDAFAPGISTQSPALLKFSQSKLVWDAMEMRNVLAQVESPGFVLSRPNIRPRLKAIDVYATDATPKNELSLLARIAVTEDESTITTSLYSTLGSRGINPPK